MKDGFVHTGQTLTGGGDAYCPLERKRRGPAALIAALAVMFAGGAFFMMSASSIPQQTAQTTSLSQDIAAAPDPNNLPVAPVQPSFSVEEALAESRAARAERDLIGAEPVAVAAADEDGFTPRLKPTANPNPAKPTVATAAADTAIVETEGVAPSLKPTPDQPRVASVRQPMRLGTAMLASDDDAPPPFFFAADVERKDIIRITPAVLFATDIAKEPQEVRIRIAKGENFVDALKRAGVTASDSNETAYAFGKHQDLRRLLPGQEFALTLGWPNQTIFQMASEKTAAAPQLMRLEYRADSENRVIVRREAGGGMSGEKKTVPLTTRIMSIAGRINGSLYMSAKSVGAPDEVIANLADAFAYDVDFQREIFGGDEFEAIFEVRYDDRGKLVSAGDILYARLKWRGRSREKGYYRFSEDGERGDFYDATGQSAKRLLMKTPIDGARLSSGFGTRKHPILGYARAHKGVDFAASRGTPIKAAGDGTILRADRYGSFGNYVKIRHANGYETAYAHLNGFGRGIRKGKRVRQGDTIGYVGTTGRSTGPHLHYEVHHNGTAVNPQRLKIATGKQLTGAALDRFKAERDRVNAMRLAPAEREALYARDSAGAQGAL